MVDREYLDPNAKSLNQTTPKLFARCKSKLYYSTYTMVALANFYYSTYTLDALGDVIYKNPLGWLQYVFKNREYIVVKAIQACM